jgi:hypothetical protein
VHVKKPLLVKVRGLPPPLTPHPPPPIPPPTLSLPATARYVGRGVLPLDHPHLLPALHVQGDGPVMRLRRWYYQFYASGEPKIALTPATTSAPSAAEAGTVAAATVATGSVEGHGHAGCPAAGAADW